MTISEREKKLLLFLALVAIIALPIMFIIRPYLDINETVKAEVAELQSRNNYLQNLVDKQEEYQEQIEQFNIQKEEILSRYPSELPQEGTYQFIYNTEQLIPIWLSAVTFDTARIDTSSLDNAANPAPETTDVSGENVETATEGAEQTDADKAADSPVNEISPSNIYLTVSESNEYSYSAGYADMKSFLKYVKDYDERMVITKLNMEYASDKDEVSGQFTMVHYAILGSDQEPTKFEKPIVSMGTTNIFMVCTGVTQSGSKDLGKPDFFAMLCQPDADLDAKIIGRSTDATEKSYITSDTNDKQDMKITFEGSGGNYTATYSIGDTQVAEKVTFSKSDAIVLEILSSPRVGVDDKVSADISVVNKTDIDVNAVIVNDDKDNPRVKLSGKLAYIAEL